MIHSAISAQFQKTTIGSLKVITHNNFHILTEIDKPCVLYIECIRCLQ